MVIQKPTKSKMGHPTVTTTDEGDRVGWMDGLLKRTPLAKLVYMKTQFMGYICCYNQQECALHTITAPLPFLITFVLRLCLGLVKTT